MRTILQVHFSRTSHGEGGLERRLGSRKERSGEKKEKLQARGVYELYKRKGPRREPSTLEECQKNASFSSSQGAKNGKSVEKAQMFQGHPHGRAPAAVRAEERR